MMTKAQYWDPIIESYAASGISQRRFCQEQQISYVQFRYYFKKSEKVHRKSSSQPFEPIIIAKKSIELKGIDRVFHLTVHLPNTIRIDIKIEQGNAFSKLLNELVAL